MMRCCVLKIHHSINLHSITPLPLALHQQNTQQYDHQTEDRVEF